MKENLLIYVSPQCKVIEMEPQGMIAVSTGELELPGYPSGTFPES